MFAPQKRIRAIAALASLCIASSQLHAEKFLPTVKPSVAEPIQPVERVNVKPPVQAAPRVFSSGPMTPGIPMPMSLPMPLPQGKASSQPMPMPIPVQAPAPAPEIDAEQQDPLPAPIPEPEVPVPETQEKTVLVPNSTPLAAPPVQNYLNEPVYNTHSCYTCQEDLPSLRLSVESLIWWTSGVDVPIIASTSPQGTPGVDAGVLGQPNTQVLYGGNDELYDFSQGGFRLRAGRWLDTCDDSGFGGEFLMLGSRGNNFIAETNGDPIIARPFFNSKTGLQDSQLIAYPGLSNGRLTFNAETRMYSAGLHYWEELRRSGCERGTCGEHTSCYQGKEHRTSMFGIKLGPRFTHLDDTIAINESFTSVASGNQFTLRDSFKTENSFLGGEIGLMGRRERGDFTFDLGLQLAIGATHQELDVRGSNTQNGVTQPGNGFYAQSSNSGSFDRNRFSLIPALEAAVGWEAKNGWKFTVSYNLMYWTNVLRAGEQIDPSINEDQFPPPITPVSGPNRPDVLLRESDYLAHGIAFGIEKTW